MTTFVKPRPHDKAVTAALATIGQPVDFGKPPTDALANLRAGGPDYLIVWPVSSSRDGSLADPWSDGSFTYQIDIVGRSPAGVRHLAGMIEEALVGVTVADRVVTMVEPLTDGRLDPDFDTDPPIYTAKPEIRLHTVPAT